MYRFGLATSVFGASSQSTEQRTVEMGETMKDRAKQDSCDLVMTEKCRLGRGALGMSHGVRCSLRVRLVYNYVADPCM